MPSRSLIAANEHLATKEYDDEDNEAEPPVNVEVIPATPEQQPILANMLELYAHDFSEFHDIELNPDGRFGYTKLPLYWVEPNRHPFLVMVDHKLAGLVLVKKGSEISGDDTVWDVAEFFVVRRYRRRGIGTEIAHKIWRRFPGRWEVRVMESNPPRISSGNAPSRNLEESLSNQFRLKEEARSGVSFRSTPCVPIRLSKRSLGHLCRLGKLLSRNQLIAPLDQLLHLAPVHSANIQPKPHPSSRPHIRRHIKTFRVRLYQCSIISRKHLAHHADNPISVMVIQKIRKRLLLHPEARMRPTDLALRPRKPKTDRRETRQSLIFL